MLAKPLAIVIVILAVSPFTQPFATIKFGEVPGIPEHQRSTSDASEDIFGAIQDTNATDFPSNPPVDIRPIAGSEGRAGLMLAASPGLDSIMSAGETTGTLVDPNCNQTQSALICPPAVLRL